MIRRSAVPLLCPESCFIRISALVSQKVETTRGVPLEFSPFCNPLSLTPVASHTLMTKSWYCQELNKKLSDVVNQMAKKVKFIINSPHRSSARWTESRNTIKPAHVERTRGGDKERGFQKGRTLRGGRSPPLVVLLFCRSGKAAALEEVSKQ